MRFLLKVLAHEVDLAAFAFARDDWTATSPPASAPPGSGQAGERAAVGIEIARLADLFLHVRGLPMERVTSALTHPFEYAELRWEWPRRLGYLVAVVPRK